MSSQTGPNLKGFIPSIINVELRTITAVIIFQLWHVKHDIHAENTTNSGLRELFCSVVGQTKDTQSACHEFYYNLSKPTSTTRYSLLATYQRDRCVHRIEHNLSRCLFSQV